MLATVLEGVHLASVGITIHTELVEYGDRPLAETELLAVHRLMKIDFLTYCFSSSVVRVCDR
jgi:hypothetical protein